MMKEGKSIRPEWVPQAYQEAQHNEAVIIPAIETFSYRREGEKEYWFALSETIVATNKVELSLITQNKRAPTSNQIMRLEEVLKGLGEYEDALYTHLKDAHDELSLVDLKKMYLLVAIEIKINADELWFTLEPMHNILSTYDQFKRFTVIGKEVVWSNLK
ncbi:hypothetical protein ACFQZS_15970 [Mucilaginibacter calamicampi]|uniref:Uncharacterized protein n=1 Tax=Mucilaginibacter calamicampi TaxID=1302352 RepID=A0ABW2Z0J9_9SPHI